MGDAVTCAANLDLLTEIRDTAVHFRHDDLGLSVKVHEVGTAAVRNFVTALSEWFDVSLDDMNIYLMPIAFQPASAIVESLYSEQRNYAVTKLLEHMPQHQWQYRGAEMGAYDTAAGGIEPVSSDQHKVTNR